MNFLAAPASKWWPERTGGPSMSPRNQWPAAAVLTLAAGFLGVPGCSDDDGSGPPASVSSVEVSPSSPSLANGSTLQLTATLRDAGGAVVTGPAVTWSAGAGGVVEVSSSGLARGVNPGQATVTATADGVSGAATVTVSSVVTSIALSPSPAAVAPGRTVRIAAVLRDEAGAVIDRPVGWSTSNSAVATVDATGLVTGVAAGSATISATAEDLTETVTVAVDPAAAVATIEVTPGTSEVSRGASAQLTATLRTAGGDVLLGHPVQWASDNSAAPVSADGVVTGVSVGGPITITAGAEGVLGTAQITITPPVVASIEITPHDLTFVPGGDVFLVARPRDAGGNLLTDRTVSWVSSAGLVAAPHDAGPSDQGVYPVTVTGAAEGTTTLSATVDGFSASVTLTVRRVAFDTVASAGGVGCGLTTAGEAFCWGRGDGGQLGAGFYQTLDAPQPTPVLAQPGLTFSSLTVGGGHVCGLTSAGAAFCWGSAGFGNLGSGDLPSGCNAREPSHPCSPIALPVAGGLTFTSLSAGSGHTCGLTVGGTAYCWGANHRGQLGLGDHNPVRAGLPMQHRPCAGCGRPELQDHRRGGCAHLRHHDRRCDVLLGIQ